MKLACLQTANLGRYASVAMETRCSWEQATVGSKDLRTKYKVRSEELQTTKFEMYTSVAMVTILPCQQVIKFIVVT